MISEGGEIVATSTFWDQGSERRIQTTQLEERTEQRARRLLSWEMLKIMEGAANEWNWADTDIPHITESVRGFSRRRAVECTPCTA